MDFITQDVIRKNNIAAKRQFKKGYSLPNAPMGEMTFMQTGEGGKKLFTQEMIEKISKLPAGEMMSLADVKAFVQQTVLDRQGTGFNRFTGCFRRCSRRGKCCNGIFQTWKI